MNHDDAVDEVNRTLERRRKLRRLRRMLSEYVRGVARLPRAIIDLFTEPHERREQSE